MEGGFPTGEGRSEAMQEQALTAMVETVNGLRGHLGVTRFVWFDLRDADSANPWLESQ